MIPGIGAVSELPLGVLPAADRRYVDSPLAMLMADPDAQLVFVLKATPPPARPRSGHSLFYAVASEPIAALSAAEPPPPATVWLSDVGLTTDPDDAPANTIMPALLKNPLNIEMSLARDGSGAETAAGAVELRNPDDDWPADDWPVSQVAAAPPPGRLDGLLDLAWVGFTLEIYVGGTFNVGLADERRLKFREYGLLFRGTVGAKSAEFDGITLALSDPMARLDTPLNPETYAGSGGIEGGADVRGLHKPYAAGPCFNIPGIPLDSFLHIFQLAAVQLQAVDAVRDNGVPLTIAADYPTWAALAAATVAAGSVASCKALGLIRCGAQPTGQITADIRGDAAGGYVAAAGAVARRLATTRGAAPLKDPDEIDAVAFAALETAAPYAAHIFTGTEPVTVAEACRRLMASVGGFALFEPTGRLTVGLDGAPTAAPVARHDLGDLTAALAAEWEEPFHQTTIGYRRNWTPQPADSLGLIDADLRFAYAQPERVTAPAAASSLLTTFPLAPTRHISTLLADESGAIAVRDRLHNRDLAPRRFQTIGLLRDIFQARIGETRRLTHPRQGLAAGLDFVVTGIAIDVAARAYELTLRH